MANGIHVPDTVVQSVGGKGEGQRRVKRQRQCNGGADKDYASVNSFPRPLETIMYALAVVSVKCSRPGNSPKTHGEDRVLLRGHDVASLREIERRGAKATKNVPLDCLS